MLLSRLTGLCRRRVFILHINRITLESERTVTPLFFFYLTKKGRMSVAHLNVTSYYIPRSKFRTASVHSFALRECLFPLPIHFSVHLFFPHFKRRSFHLIVPHRCLNDEFLEMPGFLGIVRRRFFLLLLLLLEATYGTKRGRWQFDTGRHTSIDLMIGE